MEDWRYTDAGSGAGSQDTPEERTVALEFLQDIYNDPKQSTSTCARSQRHSLSGSQTANTLSPLAFVGARGRFRPDTPFPALASLSYRQAAPSTAHLTFALPLPRQLLHLL